MQLFDGRASAKKLDNKIARVLNQNRLDKRLLIVQIGENAASEKYVKLKKKVCENLGIPIEIVQISTDLADEEIHQKVKNMVDGDMVGGAIIQLPLPRQSLKKLLDLIPFNKDIDLLSSTSLHRFYSGNFKKLPPVIKSLKYFIEENETQVQSMTTTVIGAGDLVGKPVSYFLSQQGAKVQVLDKKEKYDKLYEPGTSLTCDLLILSAGIPNLVKGEDISPHCNVVDFGSSVVDGKTVGDLDLSSKLDHLGSISPSPGGVGPLVVRFLIINFLEAALNIKC